MVLSFEVPRDETLEIFCFYFCFVSIGGLAYLDDFLIGCFFIASASKARLLFLVVWRVTIGLPVNDLLTLLVEVNDF